MLWPYIILSYLSLFALGLSDNIRGPVFPEILKSFQLSDTQGAWLFAVSATASFFGSLSGARLLKRMNKIRVLDIGLIVCAAGLLGLALAPSFGMMLFASVFFGLSMGIMGVSQNTLAALGSTPERRNQILAGLHAMYGLSSLLAPLFVSLIWTYANNWRWVFGFAAIVPAVIAVYSIFIAPKFEPSSAPTTSNQGAESFKWRFWVALMLGSYVVTEIMVSSRLALYMTRVQNENLQRASFYVSGFFVCLLAGRLLCTFVHFRSALKNQLLLCFGASIVCLLLGLYLHPIGFVLSGFTMAPVYPLAIAYMAEKFPGSLESTISTAMATQSFLIVLMHVSVGRLTDLFGIHQAMLFGPAAIVVSAILLWFFDIQRSKYSPITNESSAKAKVQMES